VRARANEPAAHTHGSGVQARGGLLQQPKAVWAVAFACVVAFMGLGLVDPILPAISRQLNATPAQVELLFTSYLLVTGVAMLVTGAVSSRLGPKWTLLTGLGLIVAFSAAAGASGSINEIIGFRAGWGLGNALFIATALAVIVGVSSGGTAQAIILYEAALGLGISVGPLLGGFLGGISWRGPFFGVACLMVIALIAITFLLPSLPKPARHTSVLDPIRALRHRSLLTMGVTSLCYNFGFFTLLAYAPFPMGLDAHGLGFVYFGWGVLLAITSVFAAPRLAARFGTLRMMYAMLALISLDLLILGLNSSSQVTLIVGVIVSGAFLGVNNTLVTTAVMEAAPVERPIASAAYSFVRFTGGGIAPWLAGKLAEWYSPQIPFYVGAGAVAVSVAVLFSGRSILAAIDNVMDQMPPDAQMNLQLAVASTMEEP
jgi:ACDE family multidrug resistance protein